MGLLDRAVTHTDQADLIILANVETIRDQMQPATPSAVAALIGGAPVRDIYDRMWKLTRLQVLEVRDWNGSGGGAQLTMLGEELLRLELIGWSPSNREARRREATMISATAGAWRSNGS